jgi:hypothetical protein
VTLATNVPGVLAVGEAVVATDWQEFICDRQSVPEKAEPAREAQALNWCVQAWFAADGRSENTSSRTTKSPSALETMPGVAPPSEEMKMKKDITCTVTVVVPVDEELDMPRLEVDVAVARAEVEMEAEATVPMALAPDLESVERVVARTSVGVVDAVAVVLENRTELVLAARDVVDDAALRPVGWILPSMIDCFHQHKLFYGRREYYLQDRSIDSSRDNNTVPISSLIDRTIIESENRLAAKSRYGTETCRESIGHECEEIVGSTWSRGRSTREQSFVFSNEDPRLGISCAVCDGGSIRDVGCGRLADTCAVKVGFGKGLGDVSVIVDDDGEIIV